MSSNPGEIAINYLAHAWQLLSEGDTDPYALAGVAVPDWLGVAARRTKCRSQAAAPYRDSPDPRLAALARGGCRHHADDGWFHDSPAFGHLSLDFAKQIRLKLGESTSMRPWFLGHILVELLLDDELAQRQPGLLDRYFDSIAQVDAEWVASSIERMAGRDVGRLAHLITRYAEVQFLRDYREDASLKHRLDQVMSRVGLDQLPTGFLSLLPACREAIAASYDALIREENGHEGKTVSPGPA